MFIKPFLSLINNKLLFVIIAEVVVCGHFEQIGANLLSWTSHNCCKNIYNFVTFKQNNT